MGGKRLRMLVAAAGVWCGTAALAQAPAADEPPEAPPLEEGGAPGGAGGFGGFVLPGAAGGAAGAAKPPPTFLKYQYSFGSESDLSYRRNRDLDRRLRDDSLVASPQVNGFILYRPTEHVEAMLEVLLEREYALKEERVVTLPGGGTEAAPRRRSSLPIDQLWVSFKDLGPADLTLGRRNFEDDRHWLYDTSLDAVHVRLKTGAFRTDLAYARKDAVDGDLLQKIPRGRIDDAIVYSEYRGIEDHKLAAYLIRRDDHARREGRPVHMGVRAYGNPTDAFRYWAELGFVRGRDEVNRKLRGHAVDLGVVWRLSDGPMRPSLFFGYASGSGDDGRNPAVNREFRQTGLHSNEIALAGVTKLKIYGEALDPDLSNLRILSAGFGFRPTGTVSVDVVWHRYSVHHPADEVRNWALSAQMNQDDSVPPSRAVGQALDVVIGMRQLFGIRKLGLDLRAGWFFPGRALRNELLSGPAAGEFAKPDPGISLVAKFWF